MHYQPGDRVMMVNISDPYTRLQPGDLGTVRRHHPDLHLLDIDWDNGSALSMCLDAGDRVATITTASWRHALDTLHQAGADAGREAADWWAQHTVGGQTTGDTAATARTILAGIDDGDPAILDTLPTHDSHRLDGYTGDADWYTDTAGPGAPAWGDLTTDQRYLAVEAFRDGYDTGATNRVTAHCHAAASPTGDGRDLTGLRPDRVRPGHIGVFSGDWARTDDGTRFTVGYVGRLTGYWNGWAVFRCTRTVARAIVADHQATRDAHQRQLSGRGIDDAEANRRLDTVLGRVTFDGHAITVDETVLHDDPTAVLRAEPDKAGLYEVGWSWTWELVDPYRCDRIIGDLPTSPDSTRTPA